MSLLLAMLPVYLFGNLHCLGMCGPLVMMLGKNRYRYYYFLGRVLSFSLAGFLAGALGEVVGVVFHYYHVSLLTSLIFGGLLVILGIFTLTGRQYPGAAWLGKKLAKTNQLLSLLLLKDQILPTFLFGFFTILLPCGQTLIVFSACALSGDPLTGLINGSAFAILTSPSLFLAMQAHQALRYAKKYYTEVIGYSAVLVGVISILRGLAETDLISHWTIQMLSTDHYHFVIF